MPGESPAFFLFLFIEKRVCGLEFVESSILDPIVCTYTPLGYPSLVLCE